MLPESVRPSVCNVELLGPKAVTAYRLSVSDAVKDPSPNGFVIQVAKPSFDKIYPAGTGGDEVRHKPRTTFQPSLHFGVFVSPVVVHDQM